MPCLFPHIKCKRNKRKAESSLLGKNKQRGVVNEQRLLKITKIRKLWRIVLSYTVAEKEILLMDICYSVVTVLIVFGELQNAGIERGT